MSNDVCNIWKKQKSDPNYNKFDAITNKYSGSHAPVDVIRTFPKSIQKKRAMQWFFNSAYEQIY